MQIYQGLFYLISSFTIYSFLLLTLRSLSNREETENEVKDVFQDGWATKEELIIVDIIEETHDVKTFRFKRKNKKRFQTFSPGQFLSFQISEDKKILRSYSISGSCENKSTLQVSIKLLKNGVGSTWFHSLSIGDCVSAFPPKGIFTDENLDTKTRRIFIAGGIGITPLISMIKTSVDRANNTPLVLFYGMKTTQDMIFHEELSHLSKVYNYFSYYPILSRGSETDGHESGHVNFDYLNSNILLDQNDHFYFCGPPVMTDSIMEKLLEHNYKSDHIYSEKFASPKSINPEDLKAFKGNVNIGGKEIVYDGKETLLEFLENENVEIDSACRSGVCGACKVKILDGVVDEITNSGLTSGEIKDGYILSCVSRPKSHLKIKID